MIKGEYKRGIFVKREEFIQLDGVALAKMLEEKAVSQEEVLQASFEQLEKVQPELNAVSYVRKEKAFAEGAEGRKGAFAGVPTALKDISQTIAGEPTTGGSRLMKDAIAPVTANFTKSLLHTGVISVGNSTTPEFALKILQKINYTDLLETHGIKIMHQVDQVVGRPHLYHLV